ncbi:MAG: HD domain-containing phosphohydrolase [Rhodocyclaceae bacterium]|nr:HD domain-containing phosphohydrolase [Rhodocyclaceae bacterium]
MVNIADLIQPRVRDREGLQEFVVALTDLVPGIERDIARLKKSPQDRLLIADLFRALHTVKGDASICRLDLGVAITHPIETLLDRMRSGEFMFSDPLAEIFLLAMDRLELAVEALAGDRPVAHLKLAELVGGLEGMAGAPVDALEGLAAGLVEAVTGFRPKPVVQHLRPKSPAMPRGAEQQTADLRFFKSLAVQFEARSPLFKGRSGRILRLAHDTNAAAGKPVDPVQLEAAIYLHDVGMMFLPESIWLKVGNLTDEDRRALRNHPAWAAGLIGRMPDWDAATEMIARHHEMPDGGGYPDGIEDAGICPGAKIIAIVDAFEAVTLKHSHRGQGRSLLRAVAEINACDRQFAPEWIARFNGVVRKRIES